ncbi:DUF1643 domain-containing protein [Eubacteriaceae bacterium ES2]|nr:DUF1643 domain-containing protein [Eubacteriaceae bacterium ES2]
MKSKKTVIKTEALFSDDENHRYNLRKEWDKALPTATVISISPSGLSNVSADLTTQLITNNIEALGFGSFELLNLYSKIDVDVKKMKDTTGLWDENTDICIKASCDKTFKDENGKIIFAWGKLTENNKKHGEREKQILSLLSIYFEKVYCIKDYGIRHFLHPLTPSVRNEWVLESWKDYRGYKSEELKAIAEREKDKLISTAK